MQSENIDLQPKRQYQSPLHINFLNSPHFGQYVLSLIHDDYRLYDLILETAISTWQKYLEISGITVKLIKAMTKMWALPYSV